MSYFDWKREWKRATGYEYQKIGKDWLYAPKNYLDGKTIPECPPAKRAEKEPAMNYAISANTVFTNPQGDVRTEAQQAKDYLILCLDEVARQKDKEAMNAFGLTYPQPITIGELKEWLKDGKVTVDEDFDDDHEINYPMDYLRFTNGVKRDRNGYKKAMKAMWKEVSDVKDQIVVFGPEKGLEALNAFKAKDFH